MSIPILNSDYMEARQVESSGSTYKFEIISKTTRLDNTKLGEVKWFGRWRQYAFFPEAGCVFNSGCMESLVTFMRELMHARQERRAFPVERKNGT